MIYLNIQKKTRLPLLMSRRASHNEREFTSLRTQRTYFIMRISPTTEKPFRDKCAYHVAAGIGNVKRF